MATISWKNAADGNWNLAGNWNPGTIPSSADIAQITIGGTYTVLLDIDRTLTGLTLGTTTGTQTLDINGYTLTLNGASTVSNNGVLNLASGTVKGTGALTVSSKLNWSGGKLTGTGKKTISGTLNLNGNQELDGTTLETKGATVWTGNGAFYAYNGAIWNNTSTGTIDLQGDADFYPYTGTQPTFNNAGTFTKSNGTTTDESYIGGIFNNTGTVQVKQGTLRLNGGGTNTGSFNIDTGATLKITDNTYNFNTANTLTGAGNFNIEGGTTTVAVASTWSTPAVTVIGGTLTGAGALTIANKLNWSGGKLTGTGKKTVSGTLNLNGNQELDGTTLETKGATVWTGNSYLYAYNGAIWSNTSTGTIDLQGDADFYPYTGTQPTFNNAGTFTKSNGTTTDESYIGGIFNNTGTVQVKQGTLRLNGGGTNTGSFSIDTGATLKITDNTYNFNTGTNFTGVGNFVVEGGTVKFIPAFNYSGAISVTNGTLDIGGTSTWSAPVNFISGSITGVGALTIVNKLNWSGGKLTGTGKKTISGTLNLNGNQELDGTTLETKGATVWTGNSYLYAYNGAIWNNTSTGTIDLQGDADFYPYTGTQPTFNNAGTFTKSNGTTTDESYIGGIFNNTATVDVKKGTLRLSGGGSNSGSFNIDTGATLKITDNTYNFGTGNTLTGAGNFNIEGGTTTVAVASTWSAPVNLIGGTLTGAGALTIANKFNWSGGKLSGTGKKTVSGTLNLNGNQELDATTLETTGATVWAGNGAFYAYNGAIWNNTSTGTIDLQGDADFYQYTNAQSTFNNAGTLIKSNGSTTGSDNSYISSIFNNTGTVDIKKGTLIFAQGYTQTTGTTRLSGGSLTFDYIPLNLQGGNLTGIGTITGNVNNSGGQVNPGNTIGTLNITGDYSQTATGTLNLELSGTTTFDKFNITGAADVGGILKLNLTGGYTPTIGTKFTVLTYGSATTKSFNTIQGIDISSSLAFAPTSTGKNLILEVVDQVKDLGAIIFSSPQSVTDFVGDTDLSDFYRFNVTTASNIQVKLTNLTANADVWLVDGLGRTIAKGIKAGTADELFNWAVDAGTYYVKVFRPAAGNNANYTLQVAASTSPWPVQNGGVYDDFLNGVSNDSTGNVYATGYGYDFDHGNIDAGIVKYNPDGTQTWFQQFTSTGNDYAFGVGNDSAGNVYATGYTDGSFAGSTLKGTSDAFITKYTTTGTQAWVKQFGTAADDYAYSISVDGGGNSYIAGKTWGTFTGNSTQGAYDAFIAKYDTSGTQTWVKQFGTSSDDAATSVILDGSTNTILVTGDTSGSFAGSTNLGGTDIFVSKYDTNGTQQWVKQLGTNNYDYSTGISTDNTGNVYVAGYTSYGAFAGNTNKGADDGFLAKYSSTGTLAWVKQFGTTSTDYLRAVKTDSAGNIYVVGQTYGTFTGNTSLGGYDGFIAKYNTSGTQVWVKQFGTTSDDDATGLNIDNQGNIYVSGRTYGSFPTYTNNGGSDGYIALFDTNGNQLSVPITSTVILPSITLAVSPASVTEDGTPNLVYTFTRTGSTTDALTANYGVGGTATLSTDYTQTGAATFTATTGTITFAAGSSTATLTVDPTADTTVEADETVGLTLATGTGYTIGTTTAVTGTITNDDVALPSITLAVSPASVTEDGTGNLVYTFTRTGITTNVLTVNYGITGTAASTDYTGATPGTGKTITFAAGSSTATLTIDPTADTTVESDETVALTLATGTGYTIGTTTAVTGTITNDDVALPTITLAVSPASVTEDGTGNLVYTFTRTGSTTNALTVNYGITGTAVSTDYTGATPGTGKTITFAAGSSTATLTIDPTADTTVESDETVALTLATGTGYTVGTTTAVTGTITNDDVAPSVTINFGADQTIVEGNTSPQNATYTVTLSGTSTQIITVQYATTNGTAIAGSDYTNTTGTLTFNPGVTTQVINIPIVNDGINEADETFTLTLTSPTNASLGTKTSATTTITDTLVASVTNATLPPNVENLTLTGTTAINGTGNAGDNVFKGNSANNTLTGLDGNDTYAFVANAVLGTDKIVETATGGIDTIDFSGTTAPVNVNLGVITSQTVNNNLKLILSANNVIENATGGTGNDRLTGNALDNLLIGGEGNDQLQGLAGNDILWGGLGDDLLNGGLGNDQYRFQGNGVFSTSLGVDYITQFDAGQDKIVLSKSTFTAITNTVGQALTNFAVVTDDALVNANAARIVYSQSSGSLFYNQDGNVLGAATVFEFARLGNLDITLASSDFSLIA